MHVAMATVFVKFKPWQPFQNIFFISSERISMPSFTILKVSEILGEVYSM